MVREARIRGEERETGIDCAACPILKSANGYGAGGEITVELGIVFRWRGAEVESVLDRFRFRSTEYRRRASSGGVKYDMCGKLTLQSTWHNLW